MNATLKITKIGNSAGIILPKEVLAQLGAKVGETLSIVTTLRGIARNHPFVDGNKRTAAVIAETFLMRNGHALAATDAELVVAILAIAAGELPEDELADWFRQHLATA